MSSDQVSEGIAAYEAGDIKQARQILSQVVKEDKTNEQAWLYLARSLTDTEKRKQCLQMVLKINPDNVEAKRELASVVGQMTAGKQGDPNEKPTSARDPMKKAMARRFSLKMLSAIPGAPESLSPGEVVGFGWTLMHNSVTVVRGKQVGGLASWWRFWLTVWIVSFINGLLWDVHHLLLSIRFETTPEFGNLIVIPFYTMLTGSIAVGAGCYLSHWYATKQENGSGSLLEHSYGLATIWAPASVLMGIVMAITAIRLGGRFELNQVVTLERLILVGMPDLNGMSVVLTLIALAIAVYAAFLMTRRLATVHGIAGRGLWIAAGIMLTVTSLIF